MLHRAASNAYSRWCASHIRTKQSKWLDNNLQEMEVKIENILKLIEEDADSFAQKAEMYYRKRPELINFVEEFYKAYRSLAERYGHISGELHKANNTIATVFPDQLQMTTEDDDDSDSPKATGTCLSKINNPFLEDQPKMPISKHLVRSSPPVIRKPTRTNCQVDKEKVQEEIDKLQKEILALQTEKKFIKGSYESNLVKYWDIEKKITEIQHNICCLQDDYSVIMVIEDDDARALMAATALKSCEDTLITLHEERERSAEEARIESLRIRSAKQKLEALRGDQPPSAASEQPEEPIGETINMTDVLVKSSDLKQERLEFHSVCEKIKRQFEMTSDMSVEVLAEKIDKLVDKVIDLEVTVTSQIAHIRKLRSETDELHKNLHNLEEEKASVSDGFNSLSEKLKHAGEELYRLQHLDKCFQDENQKIHAHLIEACTNFNDLLEKLQFTDEVTDITALKSNQAVVHNFNGTTENLQSIDEAGIRVSNQAEITCCFNDLSDKLQPPNEVTSRLNQVEIIPDASPPGDQNDQGSIKTPIDEVNNSLLDWANEGSCPTDEPDFSIKNLDVHTPCEADFTPNDPSEKPLEKNWLDEIGKTIYASNDVTGQEQGDEIGDTQSAKKLAESEHVSRVGPSVSDAEHGQKDEVKVKAVVQATENHLNNERQMLIIEHEDSPNWQKLLLDGLEDKEKVLLAEYTLVLRNCKETKRKLSEAEKKHQEYLFETTSRIRDLNNSNAMKDEEIRSLRQKLQLLETTPNEILDCNLLESKHSQLSLQSESLKRKNLFLFSSSLSKYANKESTKMLNSENVQLQPTAVVNRSSEENSIESPLAIGLRIPDKPEATGAVEEKFRRDVDELLEENLEFWMRFSASFQQIQKLQTAFQEIRNEISILKDAKQQEGSSASGTSSRESSVKPEATLVYKLLSDLQNDLSMWLEHNYQLKVELQCRFSSLCNIKEEISKVSTVGSEEAQLTAYQAAKFHGEVLDMQQENNKVADELEAGTDHVKGILADVEQTMARLHQNFDIPASAKGHNHLYNLRHFKGRTRIPLRSFLFGAKPKSKMSSMRESGNAEAVQ